MLHGCLSCKAFWPTCAEQLRPETRRKQLCSVVMHASGCLLDGSVETLSYAFLECPEVVPVVDWLLDIWDALSGQAPLRTARVLLADDQGAGLAGLWAVLLCAAGRGCGYQSWVLATWRVRCDR